MLVSSLDYNNAGQVAIQTNPAGISTCFLYDAAGRQIVMIMNCTGSSSSSSSSSSSDSSSGCLSSLDENVIVRTSYNADGNVVELIAENSVTGTQTTQYVYGTTLSDSGIASSLLKRKEIYPDSVDGDDEIRFTYNRQGEITSIRDQNGTVHAYDYDLLARQIHDRITTLGTGVDGAVRRISTSYEVRGMREKITSWNGETVGSGSVVNEVQFAYNEFGQPIDDYQAHSSTVNTSTTPKVQYAYADGSANTIRPTSITYPNGRAIHYGYGSSNSMADVLSRVGAIIDSDGGSTHLADYSYLGLRTFVEVDYTEPQVKYTLIGTAGGNDPDTGDIYRGFDRFGRIKDSYWYNYGSPADVDRIKYGYDRNGNRTYRENTVATSYGKYFDEKYEHDRLDRLKHMERGRLTAGKDGITNKTFAQCWSLDETGNWRKFLEDGDGDGAWDLNQFRSANTVNEITDISEIAGPSWTTPAYDRAGNMTTIPQRVDPTQSFTGTYDAWNRLVKLEDGSGTVAQYEYDGAKRRTVKKTYTSGTLSETRHFYYTEPSRWQVIEERVESSSDAERQFVWGLRYVDDIVLRDRDTDVNGPPDERLYGLQDANWNVTALADDVSSIVFRHAFTSYATPITLAADFAPWSSVPQQWETLYCGYRYDSETSDYYVRHRHLECVMGVWATRDRSLSHERMAKGEWLYTYCKSGPLTCQDPLGLECECLSNDEIKFADVKKACSGVTEEFLKTYGDDIATIIATRFKGGVPVSIASSLGKLPLKFANWALWSGQAGGSKLEGIKCGGKASVVLISVKGQFREYTECKSGKPIVIRIPNETFSTFDNTEIAAGPCEWYNDIWVIYQACLAAKSIKPQK